MRRSFWKAIVLASVLGMAVTIHTANADEVGKKPDAVKPVPGVMVEAEPVMMDGVVQQKSRLGALKERVQTRRDSRIPIGCYGHFNDYSCNSFHSTMHFLFGSCRTFFGEACLKGPPPSPVPGFDPYALGLDRRNGRCPGCR